MNVARLFTAYQLLETKLMEERERYEEEITRLRAERDEWANKVLQLKNVQPLFTPPPKPEPLPERPPVGQIAKNAALARQRQEVNHPTAEQTLNVH